MTPHLLALAAVAAAAPAPAQTYTVTGGKHDLTKVVCAIPYPPGATQEYNAVGLPGGKTAAAQLVRRPLPAKEKDGTELVFVLPELKAGEAVAVKPSTVNFVKAPPQFAFKEVPGQHVDLLFDGRPVLRYVNAPRDATTKDTHELTFKPFHHVFDPVKGETLLTNGPGLAADKNLLYPHHRGLFYAFNKISYGDQKDVDTWHGRKGEYTLHESMEATEAGPVLGRHRAKLSWHGRDGKTFAGELREVTAYHVPGGTLIDFASVLTTSLPKVRLDGDPQHAGFHFRAAMEVSKNGKENTYYLRPDGKGPVGDTRNWDSKKKDPRTVNLPWDACSFVVGGKRYTVVRLNHPDNPGEARGSERDYGRFGDYFEYDLTPDKPLRVKYRVWVQEGEMTADQCEDLHRGFAEPPAVTAK